MTGFPRYGIFRREPYRPTPRPAWPWVLLGLAAVAGWVYSGLAWSWFRPVLHKELVNHYAARYQFDPLWVMSVIKVESGFASSAESHRGAVGLMQLMPPTAAEIAPEIGITDFTDEMLRRPETNIHFGVYYLSKLKRLFPEDNVALLAAYNAGPGAVMEWKQGHPALNLEDIPYPETRRFVRRVQQTYGFLKGIQRWKHLFGVIHD